MVCGEISVFKKPGWSRYSAREVNEEDDMLISTPLQYFRLSLVTSLVGPITSAATGVEKTTSDISDRTVEKTQSSKPGFGEKDESDIEDDEDSVHSPGSDERHELNFLASKKGIFF